MSPSNEIITMTQPQTPRRICVVITARPSYSRIRSALISMRDRTDVELQIIASASFVAGRFGAAQKILETEGLQANWVLNSVLEADHPSTAAKTTGLQLIELSSAFANLKPDIVVTIADRFETIATAIAATYANIPLAHVQGGEVTGNIDERVRHAVTKMADIHLVANEAAAQRVERMGEEKNRIYNTGCPSIDIARAVRDNKKALEDFNLFDRVSGVGHAFDIEQPFLVMLQHPETTHYESSRQDISETLDALQKIGIPSIIFWPNPDIGTEGTAEGIRTFRELHAPKNQYFVKNLPPDDFLRLLIKCRCLVGNSSVGVREASFLGVPVVNVGSRQKGREMSKNVICVKPEQNQIIQAIQQQLKHGRHTSTNVYGHGHAGKEIADVLASCSIPRLDKRLTY